MVSSGCLNLLFECPICLEVVNNACECEKCNRLFCFDCVKSMKKCPKSSSLKGSYDSMMTSSSYFCDFIFIFLQFSSHRSIAQARNSCERKREECRIKCREVRRCSQELGEKSSGGAFSAEYEKSGEARFRYCFG